MSSELPNILVVGACHLYRYGVRAVMVAVDPTAEILTQIATLLTLAKSKPKSIGCCRL